MFRLTLILALAAATCPCRPFGGQRSTKITTPFQPLLLKLT
jgi:hypothetical protein